MPDLRLAVGTVLDWPVDHVAAAVVTDAVVTAGETERVFRLASVTKLLTAYAALIAVEEGAVDWDSPAGPPGSTVRHLAAHASGLSFAEGKVQAAPGTRRIYSNVGFDALGEAVAEGAGMPFAEYLHEAVCVPLGMTATRLTGSPGSEAESSVDDLARFAAELHAPDAHRPPSTTPPASPSPAWTASCPASAGRSPTTGGSASRSATASPRTGRARTARRGRSGTSGSRARSCGSTRTPARPRWCSPTGTSARGRSRPGRPGRTGCWRP